MVDEIRHLVSHNQVLDPRHDVDDLLRDRRPVCNHAMHFFDYMELRHVHLHRRELRQVFHIP